jgi:outer membrane protein OmpA-like peptidoglycan-associated protein
MSHLRRTTADAWRGILLLACLSSAAHAQDRLLPQSRRITDEAIARDRTLIDAWHGRADAVQVDPAQAYAQARASGLLSFAAYQYDRNNRDPVVDSAFAEAVDLVSALEQDGKPEVQAQAPAGIDSLAPGPWRRLDSLYLADNGNCAGVPIARAQVQLLSASVEAGVGGPASAAPWIKRAEELAAEAEHRLAGCARAGADTPQAAPAAAPMPAPAEAADLSSPDAVHFAFDRADLSAASERAIDEVAGVLHSAPGLTVRLDAFTDAQGREAYNRRLAARRGEAVRDHLMRQGIVADRISIVPHGEGRSAFEGGSARERNALDRRVEITVEGKGSDRVRMRRQREDVQVTPDRRRPGDGTARRRPDG